VSERGQRANFKLKQPTPSSAVAHLVDSLMPFVHPSGLQSMSRLGSPFHSR
jgi:hypothetical protein